MTTNVYLMPSVGDGTRADFFRAKYRDQIASAGCTYGQMKYGGEPTFLVGVLDIPGNLDTTISDDATCLDVPELNNTIGAGALSTVQTRMESWNIPANWVVAGDTYRSVVQVTGHIFEVAQRLEGMGYSRLFGGAVTLDTTFGNLSAGVRQALKDVANSFGLDYSAVTAGTKIRAILKGFADQMAGRSLMVGPVTL